MILLQYIIPQHLLSRVVLKFTRLKLGYFTRSLKATVRPLAATDIISPVDAQISQIGKINNGSLIQAKGRDFQLDDLLAGQTDMVNLFKQGLFTTLYLAPKNYHRIHMQYSELRG